ncbi:P-loop containing nucleoside triphosphate hydrolase protein [Aspergillus cavernicola]|uniref:DNA repair protein RAD51 homolog 3 n=1 Tax=Aspergillus cavernicola TaxID=176166 RepID=A0ABR4HD10_9EURO
MNTQELLSPATQRSRPVVSFPASQSLQASATLRAGAISTGLTRLDDAIYPPSAEEGDVDSRGISQGHVTEVFGPPGVGKTYLALNITSNALRGGRKVVWIDTGCPLPRPRLRDVLQKSIQHSESSRTTEELIQNLIYIRAQSLPHLLALLFRTPTGFPPEDCDLMVIDSASGPFPSYFPNPTELKSRLAQSKTIDKAQVQWLMNRSSNVTSDLANQLMKLATTHHMAVFVINQTRTRIKGQPRATLCPVLAGGSWESSISTRIVLYRDFLATEEDYASGNTRFAEVMKRFGKPLALRLEENIVPFIIETDGLRALDNHPSPPMVALNKGEGLEPTMQRKRKVDEIADSQDEDSDTEYGWIDGDDAGLLEK